MVLNWFWAILALEPPEGRKKTERLIKKEQRRIVSRLRYQVRRRVEGGLAVGLVCCRGGSGLV